MRKKSPQTFPDNTQYKVNNIKGETFAEHKKSMKKKAFSFKLLPSEKIKILHTH